MPRRSLASRCAGCCCRRRRLPARCCSCRRPEPALMPPAARSWFLRSGDAGDHGPVGPSQPNMSACPERLPMSRRLATGHGSPTGRSTTRQPLEPDRRRPLGRSPLDIDTNRDRGRSACLVAGRQTAGVRVGRSRLAGCDSRSPQAASRPGRRRDGVEPGRPHVGVQRVGRTRPGRRRNPQTEGDRSRETGGSGRVDAG